MNKMMVKDEGIQEALCKGLRQVRRLQRENLYKLPAAKASLVERNMNHRFSVEGLERHRVLPANTAPPQHSPMKVEDEAMRPAAATYGPHEGMGQGLVGRTFGTSPLRNLSDYTRSIQPGSVERSSPIRPPPSAQRPP